MSILVKQLTAQLPGYGDRRISKRIYRGQRLLERWNRSCLRLGDSWALEEITLHAPDTSDLRRKPPLEAIGDHRYFALERLIDVHSSLVVILPRSDMSGPFAREISFFCSGEINEDYQIDILAGHLHLAIPEV